ncbi:MAG: DUF932 domain-containing protein, partial [Planctomycetales bacterium]|nr:DUF932 domain-containing protein [Planctomycetales bacterium]
SRIMQYESQQPPHKRRLPNRLRVIFRQSKIVGFSNPALLTLRSSQVIDAIEQSTDKLPMQRALVHEPEKLDAAAWQLKLSFPFKQIEPRAGDIVEGGLSIRFSAAGHYPIQVRNWLRRLWCSNGSSVPICVDSVQLRIRSRRNEQLADQEVLKKIRQVVAQGVNELDEKLQAVAALAEQRVDAERLLSQVAQKNRLSRLATNQLLRALHEDEGGPLQGKGTRYDVWNAVTRVATHEQAYTLKQSVRNRLDLYSGCFSQQGIHLCPSCQRILEPSRN